jgi:hypothetical protein
MKNTFLFFFFFLIILTQPSLALEARVSVLQSPLFKDPSVQSIIVQYLRKGQKIILHPKKINDAFWKTTDKNGHESFILNQHVQIYFNNPQEFEFRRPLQDETDYRLEEPLPEVYPFSNKMTQRGAVLVGVSSFVKNHYSYNNPVLEESFGVPYEIDIYHSKKINIDRSGRSYFGTLFNIMYSNSTFKTIDKYASNEFSWELGFGPYISYDAFRNNSSYLTIGLALTIQYLRRVVAVSDKNIQDNIRYFSGLNFGSRLIVNFTKKNFFRGFHWLISGQLKTNLPFSLKSSSTPQSFTSLWSRKDSVVSDLQNHLLLSFGISKDF